MISYLAIIIMFMSYIISLEKTKYRLLGEKVGCIYLYILAALRYNTGTDYPNYLEIFQMIKNGENREILKMEFLYYKLNKVVACLGLHFNIVLAICSAFYLIYIYKGIQYWNKKNRLMSYFLFITTFDIYFYSLSIVRQSIVIALLFYYSKFILEKKNLKFLFIILFCLGFHATAIIGIFIYIILKINIKKYIYFIIFPIIIIFISNNVLLSKFNYLIEKNIIYPKFNFYLIHLIEKFQENISINIVILKILAYIFVYILIFLTLNKFNEIEKVLLKLFLIYLFVQIFQSLGFNTILYRIIPYFQIYIIVQIPMFLTKIRKRNRKILIFLIVIYQLYSFVKIYNNWNSLGENYLKTNKTYKILGIEY